MSLLNSVLGAVLSGGRANSQQDMLAGIIGGLIQQAGGVGGLLDKFRQSGLAQQADSWQGTGANLPIDPADLMKVLGGGGGPNEGAGGLLGSVLAGMGGGNQSSGSPLGALAGLLGGGGGNQQDQLGGLLAQVLPQVLDKMTPGGQLPQNEAPDMLQSVLGEVMKNMGGGGGKGLFG